VKSVVLVHGAWHGPWCWYKVVAGLEAAGVRAVAVELPLLDGVERDAAVTRAAIDAIDGPVVVCGHSYGGVVISSAAAGAANVAHLVYLCAFQLAPDESIGGLFAEHGNLVAEAIRTEGDTRVVIAERARATFYADCSEDDVALALRSVRPMPAQAAATPMEPPAWCSVASTYVRCQHDRAIPYGAQQAMSRHADHVLTWPTSHSPFFSRPDLLVSLLIGLAGAPGPGPDGRGRPGPGRPSVGTA
jgi:pimeloyl-ACP methyl ester carboxylesterase